MQDTDDNIIMNEDGIVICLIQQDGKDILEVSTTDMDL